MNIRLGIIGTGRISRRFAQDGWQGLDVKLEAVFNPNIKSALYYASDYGLPLATDNWEDFTDQIDAAYIAAPTPFHGTYIRMLLNSGKHVLCEKPMVLKEREAKELFALAEGKNLVLMEAVKTAYCPGFQALLTLVKEKRIGEIRDVEACFTKLASPELRELTDRDFGGSMTELGTYGCFALLKIFGCDYENVRFAVQRNQLGIDIFTKAFFQYRDNGRMGLVKSGLGVKSEGELILSGTQGYILVRAPWWLTTHFEVRYEDPGQCDAYDYPFVGNGLQYELKYFLDKIQGVTTEDPVSAQESISLAGIMEQFLNAESRYRKSTSDTEKSGNF